ncbi:hypothetical protein TKV_c07850 [Thermoanaerobacter kivui]|uniref:Lipoprotein n=1 Tax=Thermoanaerobacter kivui TaxID=2325 RepID=A0A097AQ85_THEKI|nr:hypothetical protein [Thermoanaerobacter kivui]AIS51968.1 hypothetical protein TKV_c07850 [Thermoanaerobacter kivui]
MKEKASKLLIIITGFVISACGLLNLIILSDSSKKIFLIVGPLLIVCGIIAIIFGFNILKKGNSRRVLEKFHQIGG